MAKLKLVSKEALEEIKKVKDKIAKDRDELRELISDLEAIEESAADALDSLEMAVDSLSEYV